MFPCISDGVIFRVLSNLLILDGERLSYRTLDVEQIGSVYETIMGFELEVARGRSIALKPTEKPHGRTDDDPISKRCWPRRGSRPRQVAQRKRPIKTSPGWPSIP